MQQKVLFSLYLTAECEHIANKASLRIIKTLTFFRQMGSFATYDFFGTFIHRDE